MIRPSTLRISAATGLCPAKGGKTFRQSQEQGLLPGMINPCGKPGCGLRAARDISSRDGLLKLREQGLPLRRLDES